MPLHGEFPTSELLGVLTWSRLMSFHSEWFFLSPWLEVGSETCYMKKLPSISQFLSQLCKVDIIQTQLKYYRFLTGLIIVPILWALGSEPDYGKYRKFSGQWIRMFLCIIKNLGLGLNGSNDTSAQRETLGPSCLSIRIYTATIHHNV